MAKDSETMRITLIGTQTKGGISYIAILQWTWKTSSVFDSETHPKHKTSHFILEKTKRKKNTPSPCPNIQLCLNKIFINLNQGPEC